MPRPNFPNCIMTPNIINRIRSNQEEYDKDPERWECREREEKERRLQEEWEERQQEERQ